MIAFADAGAESVGESRSRVLMAREGLPTPELQFPVVGRTGAVVAEIQNAVDAANEKLARPEQIKTFHILPVAWTAESGELTPKLSMRRRVIGERYEQIIDAMYATA